MAKKKEETVKITVSNGNLKVGDETPKEPLKIFENGNVGLGDKPLGNLDINGTFLPLGEPNNLENKIGEDVLEKIGKENNTIFSFEDDFKGMYLDHIINSVDSLQTIERGKLDLVKELILNSQKLEAITLLKSIQTLEHGKVEEIISKL